MSEPRLETPLVVRAHELALVAFAFLVALLEGPAQVACGLALVTTAVATDLRRYRPGLVELGIGIWLLAGLVGLASVTEKLSSGDTTRPLMALAFVVGAWAIPRASSKTQTRLAAAFLLGCTLNAAYGLVQVRVGALPLDALFLKDPKSSQIWVPGRVFHVRSASGLFYNRLKLAHIGMLALILIFSMFGSIGPRWRARIAIGIAGLTVGAAVVFTYARAALVALAASFASIAMVTARKRSLWVGAAFVVALGTGIMASEYGQRRLQSLDRDLAVRKVVFSAASAVIAERPIFGTGHGAYWTAADRHIPEKYSRVLSTSPHNLWLQVLAETGLIGFFGFNLALLSALTRVVRRVRRSRSEADPLVVADRFALGGVIAVSMVGLLHFPLHHAPVALAFWTLLGLCARRPGESHFSSSA